MVATLVASSDESNNCATTEIVRTYIDCELHQRSLAGQTFAARGGEGCAREGGKRTSGHFRQVFVDVAGMLALPIRLESVQ